MLAIKEELQRETSPERGLSMRDIFDAHVRYLYGERYHATNVEMYVDGNFNPPPLQSDTDIEYTVV